MIEPIWWALRHLEPSGRRLFNSNLMPISAALETSLLSQHSNVLISSANAEGRLREIYISDWFDLGQPNVRIQWARVE